MTDFNPDADPADFALSTGLLDNPEFQLLYESLLNSEEPGGALSSCPPLGNIQTQAETTSRTGSLKPDGVSSLPLDCRLNIEVGLQSPLETTVLDSSGPLDGIALSHLLHAVVELTSSSLPPDQQFYSGKMGVIIDIDRQSDQLYVSVQNNSISTKICINPANSRMLKLLTPMPGDTVRVIRGSSAGVEGCISSQHDDQNLVVKLENGYSSVFLMTDLVRLDSPGTDSSQNCCTSNSSSPSNNANVEDLNRASSYTNKRSPSFSTGWRVNSPIPSPMDPVLSNYDASPSPSLVDSVTSPPTCNQWSVSSSSELSSIPDFSISLLTDSGISSSEVSSATGAAHVQQQQQSAQSLPTTPTNQYVSSSVPSYRSLQTDQYSNTDHVPAFSEPAVNHTASLNSSVSLGDLYPVLNGSVFPSSDPSNGYCQFPTDLQPEQVHVNGTSQTGGVSYPTLPTYSSGSIPNSASGLQYNNSPYGQTTAGYLAALNQVSCTNQSQHQYAPLYLNQPFGNGLCYGLPQVQPSTMYRMMNSKPQVFPQSFNQNCGPTSYYPHGYTCTSQAAMSPSYQQQPLPYYHQGTSNPLPPSYGSSSNQRPTPLNSYGLKPSLNHPSSLMKIPSGLYPSLPSGVLNNKSNVVKPKAPKASAWDEFRALVNCSSSQNGSICRNGSMSKNMSLDMIIGSAIETLTTRDPPPHWYNPLVKEEDKSCESDLCTESVRVSALCPLTKQRMDNPCRGLYCTHLQCFDARAFLRLALKRRSQVVSSMKGSSSSSSHPDNGWKCPLCRKTVSPKQMFIEKFLKKAIGSCEATELEFKSVGHWEAYEKCHAAKTSVIDLTMDSDDEI